MTFGLIGSVVKAWAVNDTGASVCCGHAETATATATRVRRRATRGQHGTTRVQHGTTRVQHGTTRVPQRTTRVQHRATRVQQRTTRCNARRFDGRCRGLRPFDAKRRGAPVPHRAVDASHILGCCATHATPRSNVVCRPRIASHAPACAALPATRRTLTASGAVAQIPRWSERRRRVASRPHACLFVCLCSVRAML